VDPVKVKQKAIERGIISDESAMTNDEAVNLILKPGFSTAEAITETSGRGVGMDVLATSVEDMGGALAMSNKPGQGLSIKITTPLAYTTRIKLGLTLVMGSRIYLIPAENVRESFRARKEDVSTVEGKGEVVQRWGQIYPVVRLHKLFNTTPKYDKLWDAICILLESRGHTVCMMVDEIIGQRQIVYKQLTVQTTEPSAFEGVSILDGTRMALILSAEGIIKQFRGVEQ
jgi:two-component system chemotaxis sensor kinase CheA